MNIFLSFSLKFCLLISDSSFLVLTICVYGSEMRKIQCDFQQCDILICVDSDESLQPPFKLRNSKWYSVSSLTIIEYPSE